jgi:hypothetical protein
MQNPITHQNLIFESEEFAIVAKCSRIERLDLLEFELLVSSEMLFLFYSVVACVFWEIKCCVCDIVLLCAK